VYKYQAQISCTLFFLRAIFFNNLNESNERRCSVVKPSSFVFQGPELEY